MKYILHAQLYAAEMHFPLNELMLSHFFFKQNKPILFVRKKTSCADGYSENFLHLWNAIFDIHHLQFFVIQPFSRYIWCVCLKISLASNMLGLFDFFFSLGLQIFSRKFLRKDNMSNARNEVRSKAYKLAGDGRVLICSDLRAHLLSISKLCRHCSPMANL